MSPNDPFPTSLGIGVLSENKRQRLRKTILALSISNYSDGMIANTAESSKGGKMSAFETATKFFHACESLEGWDGRKDYVAAGAPFSAQCEPLVDIHTVEAYCEWMANLGNGPLKGCVYELHSSSYDETSRTAIFFATLTGTHVDDGGPVPPTNKQTKADYVYALTMNDEGKVEKMCKVWNASWTLKELGWM